MDEAPVNRAAKADPLNGLPSDSSSDGGEDDDPPDGTSLRESSSSSDTEHRPLQPLRPYRPEPGLQSRFRDGAQHLADIWLSVSGGFWRKSESPHRGSVASFPDDGASQQPHHGRPRAILEALLESLYSSWLNILLPFVPIGFAVHLTQVSPIASFAINCIAIIPLSALLTDATENIAMDAGDTIGALLNVSLGNLVELILLAALMKNHIRIVLASILGSILVNLLLILGSALLANSMSPGEPLYDSYEARMLSYLLFISVFVFLMPTAFDYTFDEIDGSEGVVLKMSRISALMVLLIYLVYFVHEIKTHAAPTPASLDIESSREAVTDPHFAAQTRLSQAPPPRTIRFADEGSVVGANSEEPVATPSIELEGIGDNSTEPEVGDTAANEGFSYFDDGNRRSRQSIYRPLSRGSRNSRSGSRGRDSSIASADRLSARGTNIVSLQVFRDSHADLAFASRPSPNPRSADDMMVAVAILVVTSALMSVCAEFLVSTIDDVTHSGHLSEAMIGLIILPIVGNIAEYVTVVTVAAKNKINLAISVAVGSSIQIALCVMPLTIIVGWVLDRSIALTFNFFEMSTLMGAVLLVNLLILNEGSSVLGLSGLKGSLMCACYVIIGIGAYLSPKS